LQKAAEKLEIPKFEKVGALELFLIRQWIEQNCTSEYAKILGEFQLPSSEKKELEPPKKPVESGKLKSAMFEGELKEFTLSLNRDVHTKISETSNHVTMATKNCGKTVALVIDGLKKVAKVTQQGMQWKPGEKHETEKGMQFQACLDALGKPPERHEVWDVTIHQHSFTLERHPLHGNLLIQAYQGAYNVQFWVGLTTPHVPQLWKEGCRQLPQTWLRPTNENVRSLAEKLGNISGTKDFSVRQSIWKTCPFDPTDPWTATGEMSLLMYVYTFNEVTAHEATLRGLLESLKQMQL
jgi:hypothetical protein